MNLNLSGKTAFVGGSTQGIGKSCAIELANMGANVVLIARNEEKLREVLAELSQNGAQKHAYVVADYDQPALLKSAVEAHLAKNPTANILINNTGGPAGGKAIDAKLDEFETAFRRHLLCNQVLTQLLTPYMKQDAYGRIINIISTSVKEPLRNLGVSNTVRGAVANWAKTLSVELASFGITVNNVLPGATKTARLEAILDNKTKQRGIPLEEAEQEMISAIPAGRFAESWEIAAAVAFLASPSASYINGINLPVDGGRTSSL